MPHGVCQTCRDLGQDWFDNPDKHYYAEYLQDMDLDQYTVKEL